MCCPLGVGFNATSFRCDDAACEDTCVQDAPVAADPMKDCANFDFEGSFGNRQMWVGGVNAKLEKGAVCMTKNGHLEIPNYHGNALGSHVVVAFR